MICLCDCVYRLASDLTLAHRSRAAEQLNSIGTRHLGPPSCTLKGVSFLPKSGRISRLDSLQVPGQPTELYIYVLSRHPRHQPEPETSVCCCSWFSLASTETCDYLISFLSGSDWFSELLSCGSCAGARGHMGGGGRIRALRLVPKGSLFSPGAQGHQGSEGLTEPLIRPSRSGAALRVAATIVAPRDRRLHDRLLRSSQQQQQWEYDVWVCVTVCLFVCLRVCQFALLRLTAPCSF